MFRAGTPYVGAPNNTLTLAYISPQCKSILGYSLDDDLAGQPNFPARRPHPEDSARSLCGRASKTPVESFFY